MNRLRLTDVKATIARVLGVCTTDSRVASYANEAHRRLVPKGKWVGTVATLRVCVSTNIITWPRRVETIEAWSFCRQPGVIRNQWYEYVGNGPGVFKEDEMYFKALVDRGTAVVHTDMTAGVVRRVQMKADVTEADGARVLVQGENGDGERIRTQDSGTWVDGEYINISTTVQTSTKDFARVLGIIKPTTNGILRAYEYNATTSVQVGEIGAYEPSETIPLYRRSLLPGLTDYSNCANSADAFNELSCTKYVNIVAKLRHIDVVNDNDYFLIGSLSALKLMVQSISKEENNLMNEAVVYEAKAVQELQMELNSYEGDGAIPVLRTENRAVWGAGVENVISTGFYY